MSSEDEHIRLDQDVLKTSSEDEDKRCLQDDFKTSLSRRMFAGNALTENEETSFKYHTRDQLSKTNIAKPSKRLSLMHLNISSYSKNQNNRYHRKYIKI